MNRDLHEETLKVRTVELAPLQAGAGSESAAPGTRLAALAGVKAEVTVVAGTATSTVGDVLALKEGAVLPLNTPLNAAFDVVLNGTVIARGELVAAGEHFGIRITQVQTNDAR
jgi:flagellar motor switch protein FliN